MLDNGVFKGKLNALLKTLKNLRTDWGSFTAKERELLISDCLETTSLREGLFLDYESLEEGKYEDLPVRDTGFAAQRFSKKLEVDIAALQLISDWKAGKRTLNKIHRQLILDLLHRWMAAKGETPTKYDGHPSIRFVSETLENLKVYVGKLPNPKPPAAVELLKFKVSTDTCREIIEENIIGGKGSLLF